MNLSDIINSVILEFGYENYLELGVMQGATFNGVVCNKKTSVDNGAGAGSFPYDYTMNTDDFFDKIAPTLDNKFDIIFIDAFHENEQTYKDTLNSLTYLKEGGVIITHDTLPSTEDETHLGGQGTAYQSFIRFRCERPDLKMFSVDLASESETIEEVGIGFIKRGHQKLFNYKTPPKSWWELYSQNKETLMNVIPLSDIITTLK